MRRVCVYCGSRPGRLDVYQQATVEMGKAIAASKTTLVYGGASRGLMGVLADTVMQAGGEVIGVIPECLMHKEIAHPRITELRVVPDLHTRKATMAMLADAFVALPGGMGTLEEITEMITWLQLGLHHKPIALLNTEGYFKALLDVFERMAREAFVPEALMDQLIVERDVSALWRRLIPMSR